MLAGAKPCIDNPIAPVPIKLPMASFTVALLEVIVEPEMRGLVVAFQLAANWPGDTKILLTAAPPMLLGKSEASIGTLFASPLSAIGIGIISLKSSVGTGGSSSRHAAILHFPKKT